MNDTAQPISRVALSLYVILIGTFIAPLLMHSSTLAVPAIAYELRLDAQTLSWFTLLNVLGNACFVLPAGKLADIYGRRRLFCYGLLVAGIACLFGGFAQNEWMVLTGRFLQGIGGAAIFGSAIALVSSIPPKEQKARVMGIYVAIAYSGIVAGPLFGGVVIKHLDWRWVFYMPAIVLLATAVIGFWFLKWERYGDRNSRLRFLDVSLYMMSLVLISLSVFRTHELFGQALLALGLISFTGFCWFQSRRRDPLLQVTLFRDNSVYATLALTQLLVYSGVYVLPFVATLYLQFIQAIDAQTTGFILLVQALLTVIVAPASGWLTARFAIRNILYVGMVILFVGMTILVTLESHTSIWWVVLALAANGIGIGLLDTQLISACMASVEDRLLGSASATLNGMRVMGGFIGMGLISYLVGSNIGKQEIKPEIYPQLMSVLHNFFILAAILTFCAGLMLVTGIWMRDRRKAA